MTLRDDSSHDRTSFQFETVLQDIAYAARSLARTPAFVLMAVIAIALGIGTTSAIFSVVNAVLVRPLPYADADRLAVILHRNEIPIAPANFVDYRSFSTLVESWGAAD